MANTKEFAASAKATGNDSNQWGYSSSVVSFEELVEWVKSREAEKIDTRVKYIVYEGEPPVESVRVTYAYPFVKQGKQSGYETFDGALFVMPV